MNHLNASNARDPSSGDGASQSLLSNRHALSPAEFITYELGRRCCNNCKIADTEKKFLRCGRCQKVFYCSPACQKTDWVSKLQIPHKSVCTKIDEVQNTKSVLKERDENFNLLERELNASDNLIVFTVSEQLEVTNGLSSGGNYYRLTLYENCSVSFKLFTSAKEIKEKLEQVQEANKPSKETLEQAEENFKQKKLAFERNKVLYGIASQPENLAKYPLPINMSRAQSELCNAVYEAEHFPSKLRKKLEHANLSQDAILKQFDNLKFIKEIIEPHAAAGTAFLNKGYPKKVEDALQKLRMIVIEELVKTFTCQQNIEKMALFFVYTKVCECSCIAVDCYDGFIKEINNQDAFMLTYLNLILLLENDIGKTPSETKDPLSKQLQVIEILKSGTNSARIKSTLKRLRFSNQEAEMFAKGQLPPRNALACLEMHMNKDIDAKNSWREFIQGFNDILSNNFCSVFETSLKK